jgi:exonuclease III
MGEFKCLSYNVKGVQNREKRIKIFNFCKDNGKNGIVLLQETHSAAKDEVKWKNEWGAEIYLNHGSSNSRGTLIAFSKGFEKKVLKYIDDKNGRIQILTFEHKNNIFMIINIYNNNIEKEQVKTLKKLDNLMGNFNDINEYSIVIAGDWNFILDKISHLIIQFF